MDDTELWRHSMDKLYLFTMGFPFPGQSMETYLETECMYYDRFSEVNIVSLEVKKEDLTKERKINSSKEMNIYPIVFGSMLDYLIASLLAVCDRNFYGEMKKLIKSRRLNLGRFMRLCKFIGRSHYDARQVVKKLGLSKQSPIENAIVYTYRFEYQAYICYLLSDYFVNCKYVARAHRYDLYEEENSDQYIPCREVLMQRFDILYLIAKDGLNYMTRKYPAFKEKYRLSYLGTLDQGRCDTNEPDTFRIVSCSNILPVKRVERIIDCISMLKVSNVEWIHFGDGMCADEMKQLARQMLDGKCAYRFMGRVSNTEVLEYYRTHDVRLFINLSDSEGIPVSIMEAMSFGIPCIATDVGGTSEIVVDEYNGYLVDPQVENERIAALIQKAASLPDSEYRQMRTNARNSWDQNFNADKNYRVFLDDLVGKA